LCAQSGLAGGANAGRRLLQPPQLPALPFPGQPQHAAAAASTLASQQASGGLLVLAQILTSSSAAQLLLDHLNRAASNGELLTALNSNGALLCCRLLSCMSFRGCPKSRLGPACLEGLQPS
jgi:hypothetical protein